MDNPQILIIGAGPAGYVCAIRFGQLGKKVMVIENDLVGGVCLNRGCIPTKTLLHDTKIIFEATNSAKNGIRFDKMEIDFNKFNQHIKNIPLRLRKGIEFLFKNNNVELISGTAKFIDNKRVSVKTNDGNELVIKPDCVIIATGSKHLEFPEFQIDRKDIITSDQALEINNIPENFIIIGAGVVGLEFATIYNRLGSRTTIIEIMDQILPGTDKEIANHLMQIMKKQGVQFLLSTKVLKIIKNGKIEITALHDNEEMKLTADKIMISVGRIPNTDNLGLENTDINLTNKKFIKVDENFQTSLESVYAIGDIIGQPLLAHKAMAQGVYLAEKICGLPEIHPPQIIPNCIYTDPELSFIGLSDSEAINQNYEIAVGKCPLSAIGKAHAIGQIDGYVKIIIDKKTKLVLGAQILSANASDLINEISLAMSSHLTIDKIIDSVHPHPTLSEAVQEACASALKKSIHTINK